MNTTGSRELPGESITSPSAGGLNVTVEVAEVDGRLEVVGLTLRSYQPDPDHPQQAPAKVRALTTADVRRLKLPELRRRELHDLAALASALADHENVPGDVEPDLRAFAARTRSDVGSTSRPKLDADHFLEVAAVYAVAWQAGDDPTQAVRRHFVTSERTAARWVARARTEHGYLRKTEKFRQNGELTAKARKALAARAKES